MNGNGDLKLVGDASVIKIGYSLSDYMSDVL